MKVKELIAELQKADGELEVVGSTGDEHTHGLGEMNVMTDISGNQVYVIDFFGDHHGLPLERKDDKYGPEAFGGLPIPGCAHCGGGHQCPIHGVVEE